MKNFFLVSVAIGFFSGTTLLAKAQSSVNIEQVNASAVPKKLPKFIEGIEIKPAKAVAVNTNSKPAEEAASIESFTASQFKYAQLLDVEVETITNHILFEAIEKWWGTRYRYGGATEKGIDCSAYAATLANQVFGLVLARTARDQYANCIKLEKKNCNRATWFFLIQEVASATWACI